jgi:methylmalonyl-CoA mutase cobalamin-binding subunit/DNA-binding transcriptional MerR regulator
VLRKWEVRYNYPVPVRNEHGDRIYSREQVTRLRTIKRLLDGGYRPSKLFGMDESELAGLAVSPQPSQQSIDRVPIVSELLELLKTHQSARFRAALSRQIQGQGLQQFVQDTMAPLSTAVGEAWSRGELRVFEEHLFSEIATSILGQALDTINTSEGRPRVLMTTLPGEAHSLGLLMAACLFALHGAHCIYLGTETPGEDIAQAALAHGADVVALSFSSAFPLRKIQPTLIGLRQQIAGDIKIVAGGLGISKQKPLSGIFFMKDFAGIDEYVARHRPA